MTAKVSGSPVTLGAPEQGWANVHRSWNPGDRLTLHIPMEPYLSVIDKQHPKRVAVMRGPVVLVRTQETISVPNRIVLSQWLTAAQEASAFRASGRSTGTFVPFYQVAEDAPYTMYFDVES